jgi:hypothetical protein
LIGKKPSRLVLVLKPLSAKSVVDTAALNAEQILQALRAFQTTEGCSTSAGA